MHSITSLGFERYILAQILLRHGAHTETRDKHEWDSTLHTQSKTIEYVKPSVSKER